MIITSNSDQMFFSFLDQTTESIYMSEFDDFPFKF